MAKKRHNQRETIRTAEIQQQAQAEASWPELEEGEEHLYDDPEEELRHHYGYRLERRDR